jgi:hypothetical protein
MPNIIHKTLKLDFFHHLLLSFATGGLWVAVWWLSITLKNLEKK